MFAPQRMKGFTVSAAHRNHISHKTPLLSQTDRHYRKQFLGILECPKIHHGRGQNVCFPNFTAKSGGPTTIGNRLITCPACFHTEKDRGERDRYYHLSAMLFHSREYTVIYLCLLAFSEKALRENEIEKEKRRTKKYAIIHGAFWEMSRTSR